MILFDVYSYSKKKKKNRRNLTLKMVRVCLRSIYELDASSISCTTLYLESSSYSVADVHEYSPRSFFPDLSNFVLKMQCHHELAL